MNEEFFTLFMEAHAGLPRHWPGSRASTLRALELIGELPEGVRIIDMGCGPGAQTLVLAEAARARGGHVMALDLYPQFLEQLQEQAREAVLADFVTTVQADMAEVTPQAFAECAPQGFDLIWSEGAIYNIGFDRGLGLWRELLKPGGCLACTEISWFTSTPPREAKEFWDENYPAMRDAAANLEAMSRCGFVPLAVFRLPEADWWTDYYSPLQERLSAFEARHAGNPVAAEVARLERAEMELYRRHAASYGYIFYLGRRAG
jgi:SAM-dependent methyltransferase